MTHIIEFPFHIGDFLSGTLGMDTAEIGAFVLLLVAHYQIGEEGLPADDKTLAVYARVTPRVWAKMKPKLEDKFDVIDGRWVNARIRKVLAKIQEKSDENKAKALKRWNGTNATAKPRQYRSTSYGNANQKPYIPPISPKRVESSDGDAATRAETHAAPPTEPWKEKMLAEIGEKAYRHWIDPLSLDGDKIICPTAITEKMAREQYGGSINRHVGKAVKYEIRT